MSITPNPILGPQNEPPQQNRTAAPKEPGRSAPLWAVIALGVVVVGGMAGLYLQNQRLGERLSQVNASFQSSLSSHGETLARLSRRLEQGEARDEELQGQVAQTKQHLGSTQSELQKARQQTAAELARQQREQKEAAEQLAGQLGQLEQQQIATKGNVGTLSSDVAGVRGEVKTTKDELAATRSQLQRVIGDLGVTSDLVAHNRTELEELKVRGEREYVEFDLRKTSRRQRVGSLQLELKRTDPKKQKYTVDLIVDDRTVEKKDKNVFEPVQFYQEGYRAPTEIVVNRIDKDRITGYVSSPKKKEDRPPMKSS